MDARIEKQGDGRKAILYLVAKNEEEAKILHWLCTYCTIPITSYIDRKKHPVTGILSLSIRKHNNV